MGAILFTLVRIKYFIKTKKAYRTEYHFRLIYWISFSICLQFLAFDTQMLLGTKRFTISPEEYVFATLSIYLDIIYLFSFLLQIMGGGREWCVSPLKAFVLNKLNIQLGFIKLMNQIQLGLSWWITTITFFTIFVRASDLCKQSESHLLFFCFWLCNLVYKLVGFVTMSWHSSCYSP